MDRNSIAVVFHSVTGTTRALAQAVYRGASVTGGAGALLLEIAGEDIAEGRYTNELALSRLDDAVAIVFASPTFMGSVSAQFKAFMDATSERYGERRWRDKLAAGVTTGSSASGDQLNAIQGMQVFASRHGMLWTSLDLPAGYHPRQLNDQGAQSGLIAHTAGGAVRWRDLEAAEYLGERVARLALRFSATRGSGAVA